LSDEHDRRLIHDTGAGQSTGMPSHPNTLDERIVDSLLGSHLIQKGGEPHTTLVLGCHLLKVPGSRGRIRIPI
jgi:hypothetical protein